MAEPMGFYKKQGLNVQVLKASSWAMIRDISINGETDATHMLSPMPLAISLGVGSQSVPYVMPAVENINGQAITLHVKHKGVKSAAEMKGFKFGVHFDYSMHNFLLRYVLAEDGVDPDRDVQIRAVPPPEMVANLRAGNLDGYLAPDPFNQRAVFEGVGFIYMLSKDIWPGHPCCAFAAKREFADKMPNTFKATLLSILDATQYARDRSHRKEIAAAIAPRNFLNQPVEVLEQVLTGVFPDGLGNNRNVPDRIDFDPFPYQSMAVWILTQLKRWGYLKTDVSYRKIADEVFLAAGCREAMRALGQKAPDGNAVKHTFALGKTRVFDPDRPEEYLKSFAISRA
jgi:nitrate/nitrite transport system substrate-binding protein